MDSSLETRLQRGKDAGGEPTDGAEFDDCDSVISKSNDTR